MNWVHLLIYATVILWLVAIYLFIDYTSWAYPSGHKVQRNWLITITIVAFVSGGLIVGLS